MILLRYIVPGRVLFHATDERGGRQWRMGDAYFARYWIQMIRYLARSKLNEADRKATLSTDHREYNRGDPVSLRVRFADDRLAPADQDDPITVVVEPLGRRNPRIGAPSQLPVAGFLKPAVTNLAAGAYHAWVAVSGADGQTSATDFTVVDRGGELDRVEMDSRQLRQAAESTKGRYYTFFAADKLLTSYPKVVKCRWKPFPPSRSEILGQCWRFCFRS